LTMCWSFDGSSSEAAAHKLLQVSQVDHRSSELMLRSHDGALETEKLIDQLDNVRLGVTTVFTLKWLTWAISWITSVLKGSGVATVRHPSSSSMGRTRCFLAKV